MDASNTNIDPQNTEVDPESQQDSSAEGAGSERVQEQNQQAVRSQEQESGQQTEADGQREGTAEEPQGQSAAQPWKNPENRAAAERRREAQEAQREKYFREFIGDNLLNPATGKPFSNLAEWNTWRRNAEIVAAAQASGVEDTSAFAAGVRHGEEQARQNLLENDPEVAGWRDEAMHYRQQAMDAAFTADLKEIRKAYPDEKAKSVMDLGEDFLRLRAHGVSNLVAYEALRSQTGRTEKNPSMGDVKPNGGAKDFYTHDEVARMSKSEVEKNFDTIKKSMKKWK